MTLPLGIGLQSSFSPYSEINKAVVPPFVDTGYEVEAAVSQYFVNDFLY